MVALEAKVEEARHALVTVCSEVSRLKLSEDAAPLVALSAMSDRLWSSGGAPQPFDSGNFLALCCKELT